jgi:hypothetical protein
MFQTGNIMFLTTRFFNVAKFANLTPLWLLLSYKLPFPIVGLRIFSLSKFALKSPKIIFVCHLQKWPNMCSNSSHNLSFKSSLLSSVLHVHSEQQYCTIDYQHYTWHPLTNNLYSFKHWYNSVMYKRSHPYLMTFISFSTGRIIILCSVSASLVPLRLILPINLIYILLILQPLSWHWHIQAPLVPRAKSHAHFPMLTLFWRINPCPRLC